jgi:3-hydroxyacyl-[acyl-carrier-protein] dehydratase
VALVKERRGIWKFKGTATVEGDLVCSAEFMCAMREIA